MLRTIRTSMAASLCLAAPLAAHDVNYVVPVTPAENVDMQIVAIGEPVFLGNIHATVGNMYCGGAKNPSFTISANHAVSCDFTHTHDVTAVYFQLITSAPEKQKCAFVVTHDFLNWSDGIHFDPDNHLPSFNCAGITIEDNRIFVRDHAHR